MVCIQHLSWRQLLQVPRHVSSRTDLQRAIRGLQPYDVTDLAVVVPGARRRSAAYCQLADMVPMLLPSGEAVPPGGHVYVIVAVDATVLWQAAATRGDVLVQSGCDVKTSTLPTVWLLNDPA